LHEIDDWIQDLAIGPEDLPQLPGLFEMGVRGDTSGQLGQVWGIRQNSRWDGARRGGLSEMEAEEQFSVLRIKPLLMAILIVKALRLLMRG
jgi:hypothetical protein